MFLTQRNVDTLEQIYQHIRSNKTHPVYIQDLVDEYGLSESKLTKGFKLRFGVTVYQFYLQCAMQYAKQLLEEGQQVKCVAATLGYSSVGSFSRAFHQFHGVSPTDVKLHN